MKSWKTIKRYRKMFLRFVHDLRTGERFRFSRSFDKQPSSFAHSIRISQEIKKNETYDNKLFNFSLASQKINSHIIHPNETFSFWNAVGNPNRKFQKGRTIQNGQIVEEAGGGLCQVSGILYHLSLLADLQILERYNHSADIYTEESRFCPLGTDATVVYGYKDLRIRNSSPFPIQFQLTIEGNMLNLALYSPEKIEEQLLEFKIECKNQQKIVTIYNTAKEIVNHSIYNVIPELIS